MATPLTEYYLKDTLFEIVLYDGTGTACSPGSMPEQQQISGDLERSQQRDSTERIIRGNDSPGPRGKPGSGDRFARNLHDGARSLHCEYRVPQHPT